jgi:hypothetical protein
MYPEITRALMVERTRDNLETAAARQRVRRVRSPRRLSLSRRRPHLAWAA